MKVSYSKYDMTAGENINDRKVVYISAVDTVKLAKADSETTLPSIGLSMNSALNGEEIRISTNDILDGFTGLTPGASYYLSQTSAGEITSTKPTTGIIVRLGVAISATELDIHILRLSTLFEIIKEEAIEIADGVRTNFSTTYKFIAGKIDVYENGQMGIPGATKDYTEDGDLNGITFNEAPETGSVIFFKYPKNEE